MSTAKMILHRRKSGKAPPKEGGRLKFHDMELNPMRVKWHIECPGCTASIFPEPTLAPVFTVACAHCGTKLECDQHMGVDTFRVLETEK